MTALVTDASKATDDTAQDAARQAYRDALSRGEAPTGKELGDQFGRSARWGRYQIDLAKKEAERTAPTAKVSVVAPPEPVTTRRRRPVGRRGRQRRPWHRPPTPAREAPSALLEPPPAPQDVVRLRWPFRRRGPREPGLASSWIAFLTGILVSISANVLHARIDGGPASLAELIGAGFWPVALLLALEVLTRVPWPSAFWWWGFARYVGIGVVALVAFVLSYRHMAGLLTSWGEDSWNAYLGPLAVDGLMLISATALLAIGKNRTSTEGKQK